MTQASPLQWPEGWPRHKNYRDSDGRFTNSRSAPLTVARAATRLMRELERMGARNIIVSSNLRVRQDGIPYSNQPQMLADPGAAVYFTHKKRQLVMATDRFKSVAGNLTSLALAVDAMRQLERHGGGTMMDRAFTGFVAIAPPDWKKPWREVFGLKPDARMTSAEIKTLYNQKARERHPDAGGADTLMAELNVAYEEARREIGL